MLPSPSTSMAGSGRGRFGAAFAAASALARFVSSPAFQREDLRPPRPSSWESAKSDGGTTTRFGRPEESYSRRGLGLCGLSLFGFLGLDAFRCFACRRLSRTPHALHSVFGPSGPFLHSGVVCVLQCAHRFPGIPGRRSSPLGACVGTSVVGGGMAA